MDLNSKDIFSKTDIFFFIRKLLGFLFAVVPRLNLWFSEDDEGEAVNDVNSGGHQKDSFPGC